MSFQDLVATFCFGYPFVMAIYWISGGVFYFWLRGRHERPEDPLPLWDYPGVSVLVPCHNEAAVVETFGALTLVEYPNSRSSRSTTVPRTGPAHGSSAGLQMPNLRVVHLDSKRQVHCAERRRAGGSA
jgi:biofilm PGA synthesis N-glycosyltransferase PgaC